MTVIAGFERSLSAFLGFSLTHEVAASADRPRLVVMPRGYQMLVRQNKTPFAVESWNDKSVACIAEVMSAGSAFITYVYVSYEELERFIFADVHHVAWAQAGVGSINIYGHDADGPRHFAVKVSDQMSAVHILSQDYLCSFDPEPERETALNGARRFHKMWVTALLDIGMLSLLDSDDTSEEDIAVKLIDQQTLPKIVAAKGFTSPFYSQLATVRDIHPGESYLREPEVRIFSNE